jgi:hypothetical protein
MILDNSLFSWFPAHRELLNGEFFIENGNKYLFVLVRELRLFELCANNRMHR